MNNVIGERIKRMRQEKGLSQEELGKILGVKKSAVQKYESGKVTDLKASKIKLLCETFQAHPWLFIHNGRAEDFWPRIFKIGPGTNGMYEPDVLSDFILDTIRAKQGEECLNMAITMFSLNAAGKHRALAYINDLTKIDEYRNKPKQSK